MEYDKKQFQRDCVGVTTISVFMACICIGTLAVVYGLLVAAFYARDYEEMSWVWALVCVIAGFVGSSVIVGCAFLIAGVVCCFGNILEICGATKS